jgi:transcriptional regulator with XRE-family HTH domain
MNLNVEALTAIRERTGLTKADLAHLAGIDRSLLTRIETGQRIATNTTIVKLAAALQVPHTAICTAP